MDAATVVKTVTVTSSGQGVAVSWRLNFKYFANPDPELGLEPSGFGAASARDCGARAQATMARGRSWP